MPPVDTGLLLRCIMREVHISRWLDGENIIFGGFILRGESLLLRNEGLLFQGR